MITYHGLLSLAKGGNFGTPYEEWWEFEKNLTFDRELSTHQTFYMLDLLGAPAATDISEGRPSAVGSIGAPTTGGHSTWDTLAFTNTPAPPLEAELVFGAPALNFGLLRNAQGSLSFITSVNTTPAAVKLVYEIGSTFHFTGATSISTFFRGWFNANGQADDPGTFPGPAGFDMLNYVGAFPDICFATCAFSPGLVNLKYDDWNHEDYEMSLFSIPGGGSLAGSLAVQR